MDTTHVDFSTLVSMLLNGVFAALAGGGGILGSSAVARARSGLIRVRFRQKMLM
ncbi:hypothetical protein [Pseudovibrio sp. Tun.PSC04-5.I4]|uniref:hypothetical protein n=1 Tax=Pseudovibrio sp. Tun.PSC04-5.I4 TaxID=1798213 RepID=UPI0008905F35|nr:hypothetical protein [Pseudovibrio sp. Tun.PSC04-5.I4]SDR01439.1 hypothetical protein SAMN04515695_2319 [Pseudovibrio sp. Tun.PSC04-5.I4]